MRWLRRAGLLAAAAALLGGCATVPRDPAGRAEYKATNDPFEPMNRKIFAFNQALDRYLIKPIAVAYRWALPTEARDAIRHVLDNLNEPGVMANCLLQGRTRDAGVTLGRLVVNSTVGVGGLNDIATGWKLPKQTGDFGQTLWRWGAPEGPYLILPLFGPSNPRDGIGMGIDAYLDPVRYVVTRDSNAITISRTAADGIDQRSRNIDTLDALEKESIDYYGSLRSLVRQNRRTQLEGKKAAPALPPANFYQ